MKKTAHKAKRAVIKSKSLISLVGMTAINGAVAHVWKVPDAPTFVMIAASFVCGLAVGIWEA